MIVVASLALGSALMKTGGADYLAQLFLSLSGGASPAFMLSGLMLLMATLTNAVSNNATAVMGTPIAISIAAQMGQPAEPFVLAVLFGANMSYATPMAYKTNLLVMNAGEYTFNEFLRIGIPLVLILWLTLSWLLPTLYGIWSWQDPLNDQGENPGKIQSIKITHILSSLFSTPLCACLVPDFW